MYPNRKINDFSNPLKSTKMAQSIDPGTLKLRFGSKNLNFGHPFWHSFFDVLRKWRKCVISEEYNAKRGSEPSEILDIRIDVPLFFHAFPEHTSGKPF